MQVTGNVAQIPGRLVCIKLHNRSSWTEVTLVKIHIVDTEIGDNVEIITAAADIGE